MPLFLQAEPQSTVTVTPFLEAYWPILVVCLCGLLALCMLLPRPRRSLATLGAVFAALAIIFTGVWLIRAETAPVEMILFYAFAGIAILSGGMMIIQVSPVRAALSFALAVLSTCGLFLLQAAPFLMAATIIVYAGAIVVTFLFVIMLAQQSGYDSADYRSREPLLASIAGFVLLAALLCVLHRSYTQLPHAEEARQLDALLRQVDRAQQAQEARQLQDRLGPKQAALRELREQAQALDEKADATEVNLKNKARELLAVLDEAEEAVVNPREDMNRARLQLAWVYQAGMHLQNELNGILQPAETMPDGRAITFSHYSGVPPQLSPGRDALGKSRLPANNVLALGRSLFTDYLLAVELAATLLLVASIGAIAIAGRRQEVLR